MVFFRGAEKRLKAAKALKEEGETPEELLRSIKENEAVVAEAQRVVDAWKAIVGEKTRREEAAKAEAERIATEKAEAERKAAEERERAEKEEEARVEAERKAEEERQTKEEERKERDENGQPFVVSSDGTTTFGEITEDTGLTVAPIKLSEGVADKKGNGYGLRHIEARHGDQIRKAGFSSVEEFIEQVAKNYDVIKEGSDRNGNKTYRLLLTDKHNNTLMIELSKDGSYWNVNTAGVFKKSYGKDKKEVYNRHTTVKQSAETAETSQADEHSGTQSTSRMNVPTTSADKGTTLPADQQTSDKENTKKVADSEGENTLKAKIEAASAEVNTEPTEAQKEAGNYKKGHVQVGTFDITIEQPEGSIRRGTDADGKKWEIKMHNTYGYFRGTEGVDGDHIDVFLSNDIDGWNGRKVFVVDQYNPDGTFDEHKVMLGFNDMDEAKSDYLANYEKGWENGRRITVSTTNLEDFEKWIDSSHRKTKPFSEYSSVNKETVATDKGGEKAEKKQKKQSVFDKAKEIADKEEKKRKAEDDKPKQKPLTEAERKDAEEVAGALGYRVEWVDMMEENGTIDADKKVIRIAKDAENPLVQVLGHEVAHGVKRMDGGKFKALQKAAMEVVGEKEWNERIEKKRKLNAYAEGKLAEEVTCDIVGEALNDKDALKRLAESLRGERGILARLRDAVVRMVEYFKNRGDKEGVRRMKAADKLLAEFESALKEDVAPEQVKPEDVDRSVREGKKDDKTLYGVHNISEDKLRKAMKLGGLANPSMAVVDKDKGTHEGFGAISLIAPSSLVDKQTGRTAGSWITDAYTQRYPFIERVMSDKGYKKFKSWVDGLDFAEKEKKEIMRQAKDAMESDKDLAWELMYLREKGVDVKGYTTEVDYPWEKIIEEYPSVEDIIKAMDHNAELKETVTKLAKVEITGPVYKAVSADVRRRFKEETGENASPLNPIIRKRTYDIYNRDYAPKLLDENGMPKASDVRKVIGQMVEKYNATKKVDFNKSKSKASTYVHDNGLYADYLKWQEGKLEEFGTQGHIFRGYKNDGTRKYVPETLSNVSKAMKEESQGQTNGSEYTSFGSFIAKLAPRVDSKEEMRGSKSRLDADEAKQEFYEKWESTYYDLAKELHSDVFSGEARLHDIVLQSDPKRYAKKEYGITLSPSFLKRLEALKKAIREDLKSAYFETKFERPVMLNEFAAAVVPKGIGDDVRKGLEDAGLVLYEYDPAKKGDRERAANEASASDGIRFNRSEKMELTAEERELRDNLVERMRKGGLDVVTDSEEMQRVIDTENERTRNMFVGEKGATEADKAEEVSTRLDNLSVARRMEEAEKNAKSIKMATGWERGTDGKWRYETGDAKIKDTIELDGKTFKRYDEDMLWTSGKFGDVVDAPELFKAYPELKDVRIETDAVLNDMPSNGEYNPRTNTITIHSDDLKYQNSILNHEIQHAIQHIEGFASGGNFSTPQLKDSKEYKDWQKMLDDARKPSFKEEDIQATINSLFKDYNDLDKKIKEFLSAEETRMDGTGKSLLKSRQNRLEEIGREITELVDELEREGKKRGYVVKAVLDSEQSVLFNLYNRLAGEVEARNTEKRIGMTEEERRASLASETEDVAREDQILLGVDNADGEINTGSVREHRVYHGSGADFDAFDHSHMGEGEGAQAYGWGTYVTEVEGIGRTYAIQNTTTHNDALRALQHDVDAISDQLNRHRDDLKYDE